MLPLFGKGAIARCLLLPFLLLTACPLFAQGPISGFMPERGRMDAALGYAYEQYDQYYFGEELQEASNITRAYNLFLEYGFSDTFSIVANIPYLWIDQTNRGLQDASLAIKYRNTHKQHPRGSHSIITSAGIRFPVSTYPTGTENPIGEGATVFQGRLVGQYNWNNGMFLHLQSGLDLEVVPQSQISLPLLLRGGWGLTRWYFEIWLENRHTFDAGVDEQIGAGAGSSWLRFGGALYYAVGPKFGLLLGGARFISGRNIGMANRINTGLVYKLQWVR